MDPHFGSILFNTTRIAGDNRALMTNLGNISVTFVPLISLVATFIPRIASRIKTLRPTQTVSSRDFRMAKLYDENSIDFQFCTNMGIFEINAFPGFDDIFYNCKPHEETRNNCQTKKQENFKDELQLLKKLTIGKIIGNNDCFYLQLYKCYEGFHFDSEKKKCILRK